MQKNKTGKGYIVGKMSNRKYSSLFCQNIYKQKKKNVSNKTTNKHQATNSSQLYNYLCVTVFVYVCDRDLLRYARDHYIENMFNVQW